MTSCKEGKRVRALCDKRACGQGHKSVTEGRGVKNYSNLCESFMKWKVERLSMSRTFKVLSSAVHFWWIRFRLCQILLLMYFSSQIKDKGQLLR